jgi:hypothetical protein
VKLEGTEQKLTPTRHVHKPIREQEKNQRRIQTFLKGGDNCIFWLFNWMSGPRFGQKSQSIVKIPWKKN